MAPAHHCRPTGAAGRTGQAAVPATGPAVEPERPSSAAPLAERAGPAPTAVGTDQLAGHPATVRRRVPNRSAVVVRARSGPPTGCRPGHSSAAALPKEPTGWHCPAAAAGCRPGTIRAVAVTTDRRRLRRVEGGPRRGGASTAAGCRRASSTPGCPSPVRGAHRPVARSPAGSARPDPGDRATPPCSPLTPAASACRPAVPDADRPTGPGPASWRRTGRLAGAVCRVAGSAGDPTPRTSAAGGAGGEATPPAPPLPSASAGASARGPTRFASPPWADPDRSFVSLSSVRVSDGPLCHGHTATRPPETDRTNHACFHDDDRPGHRLTTRIRYYPHDDIATTASRSRRQRRRPERHPTGEPVRATPGVFDDRHC